MVLGAVGAPLRAEDLAIRGSATSELRYLGEKGAEKSDARTGFFDQYDYTRNKEASGPFEVALSEVALDVTREDETPVLRLRYRSPTSDVSLSGGGLDIAESLLNQRGLLLGRLPGLSLDLDYRRGRTEEIRVFPDPTDPSGALGLNAIAAEHHDDSDPDDRFLSRRTRVGAELRLRPARWEHPTQAAGLASLVTQASLRGGYEDRLGRGQDRAMLDFTDLGAGAGPRDLWRGVTTEQSQDVRWGGGGLVLAPAGRFTLALDFDHERFREDAPTLLQTDLNALDPAIGITPVVGPLPERALRTYRFVPDTDRTTGTARVQTRLGDRVALHGGFRWTSLEQEGGRTPFEKLTGLRGNKVRIYAGHLASDIRLGRRWSGNAFVRFDHRRNEIPRDTALFNPTNGTQVDPFLHRLRRIRAGAELVYRLAAANRVAVGTRALWVDRELDFAEPASPTEDAILPRNALVDDKSRRFELYGKASLRPRRRLQVSGELGYRNAPRTGYAIELDDALYGEARASYTLGLSRPVMLSAFGRGERGRNRDFEQVGAGGSRDQDLDQRRLAFGATVSGSPRDGLSLFASVLRSHDARDFDFLRSTLRRFRAPFAPVRFFVDRELDYRADVLSTVLGLSWALREETETHLSYTFARSHLRFLSSSETGATLDGPSRIRSDVHGVELGVTHRLRPGLQVSTRYRFDNFRDRTAVRGAPGSTAPTNPSTRRHTVVLGVTLTTELLD